MTPTSLQERQRALTGAILGVGTMASDLDAVRVLRGRLEPDTVTRLRDAGVGSQVLERILPHRAAEDRARRHERLTLEESERAFRAASVLALAEAVFGTRSKALGWLLAPKDSLDGEAPMDFVDTDIGARLVEEMLVSVDEGYFA